MQTLARIALTIVCIVLIVYSAWRPWAPHVRDAFMEEPSVLEDASDPRIQPIEVALSGRSDSSIRNAYHFDTRLEGWPRAINSVEASPDRQPASLGDGRWTAVDAGDVPQLVKQVLADDVLKRVGYAQTHSPAFVRVHHPHKFVSDDIVANGKNDAWKFGFVMCAISAGKSHGPCCKGTCIVVSRPHLHVDALIELAPCGVVSESDVTLPPAVSTPR